MVDEQGKLVGGKVIWSSLGSLKNPDLAESPWSCKARAGLMAPRFKLEQSTPPATGPEKR